MNTQKIKTYNDGVCTVYKYKRETSDFNAVKNAENIDDMTKIVILKYEEMTARWSDIEFAEGVDRKLDLKIRTPKCDLVKKKYAVVINRTLYDIINLDVDRHNNALFLYLEEVRTLA
jgi:hypothetical protein